MTYLLQARLRSAGSLAQLVEHLDDRKRFQQRGDDFAYLNPDTGVHFRLGLAVDRSWLGRRVVRSVEFELLYLKPTFFALEAEVELAAFAAAFECVFEDPQIHGMGEGPFSSEGFLAGWDFGNRFAVSQMLGDPDTPIASLPRDRLEAAWRWNYRHDTWVRKGVRQFVPLIEHIWIDGAAAQVVLWPEGTPTLLPKVDYVLVGRFVAEEKRYGLATWAEVSEALNEVGVDARGELADIAYRKTPASVLTWVDQRPLIDLATIPFISSQDLVDAETLEAARAEV